MDPEHVEEIQRHFGVVAESLQTEIRHVAEGHEVIRHERAECRQEIQEEFKEVKALVRLSDADLEQRLRSMETEVSGRKNRLDRLEAETASL